MNVRGIIRKAADLRALEHMERRMGFRKRALVQVYDLAGRALKNMGLTTEAGVMERRISHLQEASARNLKLGLSLEIAEIKRAIEEMMASEEGFRIMIEEAPDGVFLNDLQGNLVYANIAAGKITGYERKELRDKNFFELGLLTGNDVVRHRQRLSANKNDLAAGPAEFTFKRKDGRFVVVEITAHPVVISGEKLSLSVVRDISARKQAEEILRAQRDLALKLVEGRSLEETLALCLDAAIHAAGMDSGGIYVVNEEGGLDLVTHRGFPSAFVKAVSHYEAGSENVRLVMNGGPFYMPYFDVLDMGISLREPELKEDLRSLAIVPIKYEGNVVACLNIASHTLDEIPLQAQQAFEAISTQAGSAIMRSKIREERDRAKMLLEARDRWVAMGEGAAGVAHDSNNNLTGLYGFFSVLDMAIPKLRALSPAHRKEIDLETLDRFAETAKRALDTIRQTNMAILDFGRRNVVSVRFSPGESVDQAVSLAGWLFKKERVSLEIDRGEDIPMIFGNSQLLSQAILNLLKNAVEACPPEGKVKITLRREDDGAKITISDNGSGIPGENREKIFDFLFTTKSPDKGTGIGLNLVKRHVEELGGTISFQSEVGKGTTFTLYFPSMKKIDDAGAGGPHDQ